MLQAESRRAQRSLGLRPETVREIGAVIVLLIAVLVFLALLSEHDGDNLIGSIGSGIFMGFTFLFGKYVAHAVPLLLALWGFSILRARPLEQLPMRIGGVFLLATSLCAIFAMPYADADLRKQAGFRAGGAIGNFLMHRECLHLKGYLGVAGCYLLLVGLMLIAGLLISDAHLRAAWRLALAGLKRLDPRNWFHLLAFWNYVPSPAGFFSSLGRVQAEANDEDDFDERVDDTYEPDRRGRDGIRFQPEPAAVQVPDTGRMPRVPAVALVAPTARPVTGPQAAPVPSPDAAAMEAFETPPAPARRKPVRPTIPMATEPDLLSLAEEGGEQEDLPLFQPYELPALDLLNAPPKVEHRMNKEEIVELSETLERALANFGISAQVTQVTQGPTVTRFEMQPAPGIKVSRILGLENDIAMSLCAESVRIIAPIPGKGAVGLEVPNRKPTPVVLREILATEAFINHPSPLAFALGKTISGEPYICDLAAMPHLLIAGTTGSGKSVCLNSIICSILFRMAPEKVRFIMVDPKRVELNVYKDIPHLLAPVVCEPRKAAAALTWAIEQMEERYKRLAALGVRNIDGYNAIVCSSEPHPKAIGRQLEYMQHIVIVIDELADLMIIARNEVEDNIIRLAQMSRAVGMHLIIATQRPSVNVITGIIKANFPSRVAFQVSSKVDSRTILDANGAESLLGRGDMLFSPGGSPKPIRLQGCYVSDQEVERAADFVREQQVVQYMKQDFATQKEAMAAAAAAAAGANGDLDMDGVDADDSRVPMPGDDGADDYDYEYRQERRDGAPAGAGARGGNGTPPRPPGSENDGEAIDEHLFTQAVKLILTHRKASVSLLQRKLKIGFARAGRLMDMVEEEGIVGPNVGSKVREIIVDPDEYLENLESREDESF